jgi:hypothetical protein
MQIVGLLPDWLIERAMKKYNENPPMPKNAL